MRERDFVRPPAVAGLFYPSDKRELKETCEEYLECARSSIKSATPKRIVGMISPHAGYPYSGLTAAHGYSVLRKGEFEKVVVISPSHREYFEGISVFSGKAYSTPLGEVEVDTDLREMFLETAGDSAVESRAGHKGEHALEVQLPFLQLTLGNFRILPLVMGDQNRYRSQVLGKVLEHLAPEGKVLIVASSDLSHYYDYETANRMDGICIADISDLDPKRFMDDVESHRCEACGGGPIFSLLLAAKGLGAIKAEVLHHCNSGDTTGDKSGVVGYLSAIVS